MGGLLSVVMAAGCFGDDTIACDFRAESDRCQDRSGTQAASPLAFEATCEAAAGDYLDGPCPRSGIVGGCDIDDGDVIDWYYAPKTLADVEFACEGDGEVVPP